MSQPSILERVKEMTRQALEREAEKLLALDLVKDAISEAAKQGFTRVTVIPDKAIDMAQTTAAKATVEALRAEGFGIEWDVRVQPDGRACLILVVNWQ